jgi:virginiamycin B lyase
MRGVVRIAAGVMGACGLLAAGTLTAVTPAGAVVPGRVAGASAAAGQTFQAMVTPGRTTVTSCHAKQQSEPAVVTSTPAAAPVREGDVEVYADPGGSSPIGITEGPDGAMWYGNASSQYSIGRITSGGAISHYSAAGLVRPFGIAAGPGGALWFTGSGSIGRITTAGAMTLFTGTCIGSPDWIAAGPDGTLWFTTVVMGVGDIGRITSGGMVTVYTGSSIDEPAGITAGPDGALWFVNSTSRANSNAGSIGRITTTGEVSNYPVPGVYRLSGIAAGPGSTLWFTGMTPQQAWLVAKMTTSGAVTEYKSPGLGQVGGSYLGDGGGIAEGPDGAMWFTDYGPADAIVGRLATAAGTLTPYATPGRAVPANEIASGPGDALWFTMGTRGIGRLPAGNPSPCTRDYEKPGSWNTATVKSTIPGLADYIEPINVIISACSTISLSNIQAELGDWASVYPAVFDQDGVHFECISPESANVASHGYVTQQRSWRLVNIPLAPLPSDLKICYYANKLSFTGDENHARIWNQPVPGSQYGAWFITASYETACASVNGRLEPFQAPDGSYQLHGDHWHCVDGGPEATTSSTRTATKTAQMTSQATLSRSPASGVGM